MVGERRVNSENDSQLQNVVVTIPHVKRRDPAFGLGFRASARYPVESALSNR